MFHNFLGKDILVRVHGVSSEQNGQGRTSHVQNLIECKLDDVLLQ